MVKFLSLQDISASFEPQLSQAIQRVVRSGWYLNGEECTAFEREFSTYLDVGYTVGVGNGLDALTLSLLALKKKYGLSDNDEVILPNMTFIATAEAVVRANLVPVFVDVSETFGVLTVDTIIKGLTSHTKIILPVHLFGYPAPMDEICEFAQQNQLLVLEDVAQAHGASILGRKMGHWGHIAAFSFYPGKNLGALGDGGAVVTDDLQLAKIVRILANYGAEKKYYHSMMGINSRLDEIQAAVLRVKLRRLDTDNTARRKVAEIYSSNLKNLLVQIPFGGNTDQSVFHIYPLRTKLRDQLKLHLAQLGIETLIHYPLPVSCQAALSSCNSMKSLNTPCAFHWAEQELSLPISPLMKEEEIWRVINAINAFEGKIS